MNTLTFLQFLIASFLLVIVFALIDNRFRKNEVSKEKEEPAKEDILYFRREYVTKLNRGASEYFREAVWEEQSVAFVIVRHDGHIRLEIRNDPDITISEAKRMPAYKDAQEVFNSFNNSREIC